jgi:hypothetical protein
VNVSDWWELRRLRSVRGLVIAAHPDDEVLWAGNTLASGGWGAAVLTHRSTPDRVAKLKGAAAALNAPIAVFDLPDRRDAPATPDDLVGLTRLVGRLLSLPNLEKVMTHGPDGEYGHPFHRLVSDVVTEVSPVGLPLWYFSFRERPEPVSRVVGARKQAGLVSYFGATRVGLSLDQEHVLLSAFEQPVLAAEFAPPTSLVDAIYGRRGERMSATE